MTIWLWIAGVFCVGTTALHVASHLIVVRRCRAAEPFTGTPGLAECGPGISIVRPVCGIDNYVDETLRSAFQLDYSRYGFVFCVAHANDPVVPIVQRLIADHPHVPARLLVGNESIGDNPKLNNVYKGWRAAEHDWIVMADSNVLMPGDYIQRLMGTWRDDTGLVASPPIGCWPDGFWAELECAFLNTYEARWQYVADTLGVGFAQGKTMFWRRSVLEDAGGIRLLGLEPAEDAASTKVVRDAGLGRQTVDKLVQVWRRDGVDAWVLAHIEVQSQEEAAFAQRMFGLNTRTRFRCDYFPFVEPGVDFAISCFKCDGSNAACSICHGSGWLEILGAGMVHPRVLERVGYDSSRLTGFAWGMGVERIAMIKYGIEDIRLFYANDLRFLEQFK